MRICISSLVLAALLGDALALAAPPQAGGAPAGPAAETSLLFLVDFSESMADLEDTTQALITHTIKLAELSGKQIKIAVIFFGGNNEVIVVGDHGMPTAAYKTLLGDLRKNWPKPRGATPFDSAMQLTVKIATALPRNADLSVVLLSDGQPESGMIRPEAFPEIRAEIDRQMKALQSKHQNHPPAIVQQVLARHERVLRDPRTAEGAKLYTLQLEAEFKKTLEHAGALKKAGVRFLSVDYAGGLPELKQIHEAAGGKADDLILAKPATTALARLHARGLTTLPNVIVQQPLAFAAEPGVFEKEFKIKLDPVGERAVVTLVFDSGIPNFDKHAVLEATVAATKVAFSISDEDPSRTLSFDSAGKLVAAHLQLDALPPDGQVSLAYRSPGQTWPVPSGTLYVHLRIAADLTAVFRPAHVAAEAIAPYRLAPKHPGTWIGGLSSKSTAKWCPLQSLEAVVHNRHAGSQLRIDLQPDPKTVRMFASEPTLIPAGTWDVELHLVLETGARIVIKLPQHILSQEGEECLTLEITQKAGTQTEHASHSRGHCDFGELGDACTQRMIDVLVRSRGFDYPIAVTASVDPFTDAQGTAPKKPWLTCSPAKLHLQPGRAERLRLTVRIPAAIEEEIVDGPFQGVLQFVRTDTGETLTTQRFQRIAGVSDDEPVNRIACTLRRPRLQVSAPRCLFRNAMQTRTDGASVLTIRVSVGQPFRRQVDVAVTHDSTLPRTVTVRPSGILRDPAGKDIPSVRLVLSESCPLTQEVPCGGSATWTFLFEIDHDPNLQQALGELDLSAPGLQPVHVAVEVFSRQPLLGSLMQRALWGLAAVLAVLGVVSLVRWLRARRFQEGGDIIITPERPLAGLLTLKPGRRGRPSLVAQEPLRIGQQRDSSHTPLGANRVLPVSVERLTPADPLIVSTQDKAVRVALTKFYDDPPEVHGEILEAPEHMEQAVLQARRTFRRFCLAGTAVVLAVTLLSPTVLPAAQWLVDLVSF